MNRDQARYSHALQDLYQRTTQGIKLGLDNTSQLLEALGNPHRKMKHVVVAGTNGKGSTSSLLAQVCQAAGYTTGLYTSPHLLRFTERIQINGCEISTKAVLDYYDKIREVESACDALPTFFEVTTAMALMAFAEQKVDIAIMEVGLGGRLDSTNVVEKCLSIITPIALDHVHILGNTLGEIAAEKAGIIAPGAPALTASQRPEAQKVLIETAARHGTQLHVCGPYRYEKSTIEFTDAKQLKTLEFHGPDYQAANVATVFHALPLLSSAGFQLDFEHLKQALQNWIWPGRFQQIDFKSPVILDGAHNPHALDNLMQALKRRSPGPVHAVFSAIHTKDAGQMVETLTEHLTSVHLCPSSVGKSLSQQSLQEVSSGATTYANAISAFEAATTCAQEDGGLVLVTGSLFLVADILHHITGERRDPGVVS